MTLDGVSISQKLLTVDMVTGKNVGRIVGVAKFIPDQGTHPEDYRTRLGVQLSTSPTFAASSYYYAPWREPGFACAAASAPYDPNDIPYCQFVTLPALLPNTKYYVRVFMDYYGASNYDIHTGSFYTDRTPLAPTLVAPNDNTQFSGAAPINFDWDFHDPDAVLGPPYSVQNAYELRYRTTANPLNPAGPWVTKFEATASTSTAIAGADFDSNSQYEWQVRTRDHLGSDQGWGPWSDLRVFYVGGDTTPPLLVSPVGDVAIRIDLVNELRWQFRDPDQTATQIQADLRWRIVGGGDWEEITGVGTDPGPNQFFEAPEYIFEPSSQYEWQVRTYNSLGLTSEWSNSSFFWGVLVGENSGPIVPEISENQPVLGQGHNRAYVYARGGRKRIGEITPLAQIQWTRKRDDISNCTLASNGLGEDGGQLLRMLRTWRHEIVVYRDDVRVWEGPITRIEWDVDQVSLEAKDVMAYVYRRILRQGYNDAYRIINGVQRGLHTVVYRARQIIMNALSYDDPNVLPFVTAMENIDDTVQSRVVAPWSKTAWGEVDDLAATAGLDYTVVGRRIILIDTHRQVGQLPEMRDGDFSAPPKVTEYGMQAANVFGVTNNSGIYGFVNLVTPTTGIPPEGYIEQLASAYGETTGAASETVLTPAAKAKLEQTLRLQAERNIAPRWPVPVLVRVPDNSTLMPDLNISINQLVPGVWIPLAAVGPVRRVSQMQKLDSVTVTETGDDGEKIAVVMSPAPGMGVDELDPEEV